MQVSGYANYISQIPARTARSDSAFAQALKTKEGDPLVQGARPSPSIGTDTGANDKLDYSNMTPRQFVDAGKSLYKEGRIDEVQLFEIHMTAGFFDGQTNEFSESQKPFNYIASFQDKLLCNATTYNSAQKNKIRNLLNIIKN